MRTALVTGGAGFLGRRLIAALLAQGVEVRALCRQRDDLLELAHPALSVEAGDLEDATHWSRLCAGRDTLFHLAALRNRPGASPELIEQTNVVATSQRMGEAADVGVGRIVHLSTALVYGPSSFALDESASLCPGAELGAYAASKSRALTAVRALVRAGAPVVTLLPTIVFGPDHPARPNRVTSEIRRLLRRPITVGLAANARRDLVHVDDVVAAMCAAATLPGVAGAEFILGGEPASQRSLAALVAQAAGRRPPLLLSLPVTPVKLFARLVDRARGFDPRAGWALAVNTLASEWTFSSARAREVLAHRPRPLARGIAQTVDWIRTEAR